MIGYHHICPPLLHTTSTLSSFCISVFLIFTCPFSTSYPNLFSQVYLFPTAHGTLTQGGTKIGLSILVLPILYPETNWRLKCFKLSLSSQLYSFLQGAHSHQTVTIMGLWLYSQIIISMKILGLNLMSYSALFLSQFSKFQISLSIPIQVFGISLDTLF